MGRGIGRGGTSSGHVILAPITPPTPPATKCRHGFLLLTTSCVAVGTTGGGMWDGVWDWELGVFIVRCATSAILGEVWPVSRSAMRCTFRNVSKVDRLSLQDDLHKSFVNFLFYMFLKKCDPHTSRRRGVIRGDQGRSSTVHQSIPNFLAEM